MIGVQLASLALVAAGGTAVALARDPVRQSLLTGFSGLALVALFVVFQAPDVALSAVIVGAVALPLLLLLALARVSGRDG
jgi:energy-converting hydrogenase B subunit D